ncbi:MAG: hypothetical protein GY778_30200 [bacterium]|nr:hypothetical protein [bacterium]
MQMSRKQWCCLGVTVAAILATGAATLSADAVEDEYKQRVRALADDDLSGHYKLALWCKEQEAYKLLRRQCNHILQRNPKHEQARLLRELAERKLDADGGDDEDGGGREANRGKLGRILDKEDIQKLRRMELHLDRRERVAVRFQGSVLKEFFDEYRDSGELEDATQGKAFVRLPPPEKAQVILRVAPETYGQQVELTTDPARFVDFERKVLPVVLENCATSACHGTNGVGRFRLYNDKVMPTRLVYTNYLIMHEFTQDGDRVIDRHDPERSLILRYGLGSADPDGGHPVPIAAPFSSTNDRKYRAIRDWIETLSLPSPEYGISLEVPDTP